MFLLFEEKKIKFKKCARAILDSDDKMPSCYQDVLTGNPKFFALVITELHIYIIIYMFCIVFASVVYDYRIIG